MNFYFKGGKVVHIYILFIIISAVIAITLYYAANGKSTFLLVLMALIAIAGLIAGVLFPLMATRVLDAPNKTVEEKHDLIAITQGNTTCYLVQNGEVFQFVYYTDKSGLKLGTADMNDVSITYQDGASSLAISKTISTHHNSWLIFRDSTETKVECEYHFFIPRDAVWYPYETN